MAVMASLPLTPTRQRIHQIDGLRGVALLGILIMNSISYAHPTAAYLNLPAAGIGGWWDWAVGLGAQLLVDQKMMSIFSLLFGAGMVMFAERARHKGSNPLGRTLLRNAILAILGLLHSLLWDGDILLLYALCAPLAYLWIRRSPAVQLAWGALFAVGPAIFVYPVSASIDAAGTQLGEIWSVGAGQASDDVFLFWVGSVAIRALGMMLIGMALYQVGFLDGRLGRDVLRPIWAACLAFGLPTVAVGIVIHLGTAWSPQYALLGQLPNNIATPVLAVGFSALILDLYQANGSWRGWRRIEALGKMALTNYLSFSVLGLLLWGVLLPFGTLSRSQILLGVFGIWAIVLLWSPWWVARFYYGPVEWLWRWGTYGKHPPMRRKRALRTEADSNEALERKAVEC